jgi:DNA-directed RNA polymerase subunit omega
VARITIEDCLEKIPSRFQLVHMAAKRVRQIREGSEYLVSSPKNEDIVVALREIAAGKVRVKIDDLEVEERDEKPVIPEMLETQDIKETEA